MALKSSLRLSAAAGRVRPTGRLPGAAHVASLFLRCPNFYANMTVKLTVQTRELLFLPRANRFQEFFFTGTRKN